MSVNNLWLPSQHECGPRHTQLLCLPHAGGGSAIFHRWQRLLPGHLAVLPLKLPGRESRFNESAHGNLKTLINALTPGIADVVREPFALFGHSMGGLVAYELAQRLRSEHGITPQILFVSACRSPDRFRQDRALHRLPDEEMIASLVRDFNKDGKSHPAELEMMRTMAETIRADLKLLETYEHPPHPPLDCPIVGIAASEDKQVTAADVNGWQAFTTGRFMMRTMPGSHFFLREQETSVMDLIASKVPASDL